VVNFNYVSSPEFVLNEKVLLMSAACVSKFRSFFWSFPISPNDGTNNTTGTLHKFKMAAGRPPTCLCKKMVIMVIRSTLGCPFAAPFLKHMCKSNKDYVKCLFSVWMGIGIWHFWYQFHSRLRLAVKRWKLVGNSAPLNDERHQRRHYSMTLFIFNPFAEARTLAIGGTKKKAHTCVIPRVLGH